MLTCSPWFDSHISISHTTSTFLFFSTFTKAFMAGTQVWPVPCGHRVHELCSAAESLPAHLARRWDSCMHVSSFPAIFSSKEKCLSAFANQNLFILNLVIHPERCLLGKSLMHYCVRWINLACLIDNTLLRAQAGLGEVKVTIKRILYERPPHSGRSHATVPAWLRCLRPPWYYCPLCSLRSLWMRIRFQQVWRWRLFLTRQIDKASIRKSVGEAHIQRPCQICFSPKQGETKEISSIPPRHKEHVFTLQMQGRELSSLSQELVPNSIQLKKILTDPFK